jgi:hypothetical protein
LTEVPIIKDALKNFDRDFEKVLKYEALLKEGKSDPVSKIKDLDVPISLID